MPQPIHHTHLVSLSFGFEAFIQRPAIAPFPALIMAHWNELEARVAVFMAALLKQEAPTVVSIFLALTGDGPKRAFVDAVVDLKLSTDEREQFRQIQKNIGGCYSQRNDVVHGAWGVSPEYPEKMLWAPTRDSIELMPKLMMRPKDGSVMKEHLMAMQRKIRVWDIKDFENVVKRMEETRAEFIAFSDPHMAHYFGPV